MKGYKDLSALFLYVYASFGQAYSKLSGFSAITIIKYYNLYSLALYNIVDFDYFICLRISNVYLEVDDEKKIVTVLYTSYYYIHINIKLTKLY
jgi:hypothetical protein